jgi:hypothetical protein
MEQEHDGARAAWMSARTQLATFKKAHPSLNAQLRAAEVELQHAAAPIQRKYRQALDYFRVGQSKRGMRIG